MELHSYAKHRTAKKWSLEQKRRLVEARINCDNIFQSKPKTSILPWKSVIFQAKLDDFNFSFVRKQWANMVTKYMQYKQARLGNRPTHDIDAEAVEKITKEWEFFEPIHRYMTRKTTNLHSYALTSPQHGGIVANAPSIASIDDDVVAALKQNSASSNERLNACSSDTNDAMIMVPNTDHDFYSKPSEQQQFYFADIEEDTLESITTETVTNWTDMPNSHDYTNDGVVIEHADVKVEQQQQQKNSERTPTKSTKFVSKKRIRVEKKLLTEREKYYRHKRRYNHRMERRFDALFNVIGQFAKGVCPSVDISPLLETGGELMKGILTSSSSSSSENEA